MGAADDAILFPASSITRIDPTSATSITVSFAAADGTLDEGLLNNIIKKL